MRVGGSRAGRCWTVLATALWLLLGGSLDCCFHIEMEGMHVSVMPQAALVGSSLDGCFRVGMEGVCVRVCFRPRWSSRGFLGDKVVAFVFATDEDLVSGFASVVAD